MVKNSMNQQRSPSPPTLRALKLESWDELDLDDKRFLEEQEARVENGAMEVAMALLEIRNYKSGILFKDYGELGDTPAQKFEDYVRRRFNYQKQYAHRLLVSGEFISQLKDEGIKILPVRESHVRVITSRIPEENRAEFWREVTSENLPGEMTAPGLEAKAKDYVQQHKLKPAGLKEKRKTSASPKDAEEKIRSSCRDLLERLEARAASLSNYEVIKKQIRTLRILLEG